MDPDFKGQRQNFEYRPPEDNDLDEPEDLDDDKKNDANYYTYDAQSNMTNHVGKYIDKSKITSSPSKDRLRYSKVFPPVILFLVLIPALIFIFGNKSIENPGTKIRTFMIYMVGSDLESKSMQGTYSIDEIVGSNVDLKSNNILLMVGGSKKWHNFVKSDEIAIYELTKNGFEKKQENEIVSMGSSETLTNYLNYAYDNYPAQNYDLIFWNHGLGAIGLEHDEVADDFLAVNELDAAFKNSKFNDKKLELAIFYNCLTENLHVADIMSNYANYMLGSEEIIYLSKLFSRFSFFEDIKKDDDVYAISKKFIDLSDSYIKEYNKSHKTKINSTLSLLDLSKINKLKKDLDNYINSIEITDYYFDIARVRKNIYTYGKVQNNNYDTVDLYSLVDKLVPYSSNKTLKNTVQSDIDDLVVINSSSDNYSNGLSVYFPYYNTYEIIDTHLSLFDQMWNTSSYINFIKTFNDIRFNYFRSSNKEVKLTNDIKVTNDLIEIDLTNEESEKYQGSNIYIFNKDANNKYELLLKSNNLSKDNNKLKYNYDGLLKVDNDYVTFIDQEEKSFYGNIANNKDAMDTIFKIDFENGKGIVDETVLDSGNYPLSSIVDVNDFNILSLSKYKYDSIDNSDWKDSYIKENVESQNYIDNLNIIKEKKSLKDLYIMIETYDINNDSYYSKIMKVV